MMDVLGRRASGFWTQLDFLTLTTLKCGSSPLLVLWVWKQSCWGQLLCGKCPVRNRQKHSRWVDRQHWAHLVSSTPSLTAPWAVEPSSLPFPVQMPLTAPCFVHQMSSRWLSLGHLACSFYHGREPRFSHPSSDLWVPYDDVVTPILCPSHTLQTSKPESGESLQTLPGCPKAEGIWSSQWTSEDYPVKAISNKALKAQRKSPKINSNQA